MSKEEGDPKPWSADWVFQQTYFCNVRREDDKVTRWIRGEWTPEFIGWDDYEYAMLLARFLNWPETLDKLHGSHGLADFVGMEEKLDRYAKEGKVWGNAYVITTHGIPMPKATYLCQRVLPAAYELLGAGRWRGAYGSRTTLAARHKTLLGLEGVGSFIGAQIIADLKNTEGHPLYKADDWYSWSAPGPGSLRGLEWFFGRRITEGHYAYAMDEVRAYIEKYSQSLALYQGAEHRINMQDLQNCLCEYDKYLRVKTGRGRSKRKYHGT